jgi:hypothetical protein
MGNDAPISGTKTPNIGRSLLALFCGFLVAVILSLGTDFALHELGLWPDMTRPMSPQLFGVATIYRTIYGVLSAYIVARLAPNRPLEHALVGGCIGLVLSIAGAAATWSKDLGPHWYPVALIVLALPSAWAGGMVRIAQLRREVST